MDAGQLDSNNVLQTRASFVASKIREFIQQGYFEPGKKLDQNEIAELLNVSRSPVREAIRTLAAEGLVKVYPHRRAVVTQLSLEELEEIFLMRAVLEGLAARLGVANIDDERLAQLKSLLDKLNSVTDFDEWLALNRIFHQTIYQAAAPKPRLFSSIDQLRNTATPYIRQYITSLEHIEAARIGHQQIYEACLKRDPELAQKVTQKHIDAVREGALIFVEAEMNSLSEES